METELLQKVKDAFEALRNEDHTHTYGIGRHVQYILETMSLLTSLAKTQEKKQIYTNIRAALQHTLSKEVQYLESVFRNVATHTAPTKRHEEYTRAVNKTIAQIHHDIALVLTLTNIP